MLQHWRHSRKSGLQIFVTGVVPVLDHISSPLTGGSADCVHTVASVLLCPCPVLSAGFCLDNSGHELCCCPHLQLYCVTFLSLRLQVCFYTWSKFKRVFTYACKTHPHELFSLLWINKTKKIACQTVVLMSQRMTKNMGTVTVVKQSYLELVYSECNMLSLKLSLVQLSAMLASLLRFLSLFLQVVDQLWNGVTLLMWPDRLKLCDVVLLL